MTIEQLLDLDKSGWEAISKMSKDELKEYLKDVTKLEPEIISLSSIDKIKEKEEIDDDPNPIKSSKHKKSTKQDKNASLDAEFEKLMKDL